MRTGAAEAPIGVLVLGNCSVVVVWHAPKRAFRLLRYEIKLLRIIHRNVYLMTDSDTLLGPGDVYVQVHT